MKSNNLKYLSDLIPFICLLAILQILNELDIEQKVIFLSTIITILYFFFQKYFRNDSAFISKLDNYFKKSKKMHLIFILFITFLTIITQNYYLNYEQIDWDIPSYLVAASDILRGNLPLENQWESKGPIFFYLYSFMLILAGKNYVYFKILNDIILLFLSFIVFKIVSLKTNKNFIQSFLSSTLFILLFSLSSLISEYSELYSLLFISLSYYLFQKNNFGNINLFAIGILMSFSTLVNQGSVLFLFPYFISVFFNRKSINYIKKSLYMTLGFILPHLFFLLLYYFNGLADIYIATFIEIPFKYTSSSFSYFYELRVFFRQYYELNEFLYTSIFILIIFYIFNLINSREKQLNFYKDFDILNLFFGLSFYIIASHNYYHHLFFVLFFIPFFVHKIKFKKQISILLIFILLSSFTILNERFSKSYNHITNTEKVLNDYPIYQLSNDLKNIIEKQDYKVFALDYALMLFYLDKPNYTYVIHPSNFEEIFIVETLNRLGYQNVNIEDEIVLGNFVDVIICSPRMVINGEVRKNPLINCDVSAYNRRYFRVDTLKYNNNPNLEYVNDPYKEISLYVKSESN